MMINCQRVSQIMGAAEKQNLMMKGLFLPADRPSLDLTTFPSGRTQMWLTKQMASVAKGFSFHCKRPEELRELDFGGKTWDVKVRGCER